MIVKKEPYNPVKSEEYLTQIRQRKIIFIKRDIQNMGITMEEYQ